MARLLHFSTVSIVVLGVCLSMFATSDKAAGVPKTGSTPPPAPAQTTTPTAEPAPIQFAIPNKKALFILALGQDADTKGKLTAALAEVLPDYLPDNVRIVSEPEWTVNTFMLECQTSDKNSIAGAFIAQIDGIATDQYTSFFFKRDYVNLAGTAFYASCDPPDSNAGAQPRATPDARNGIPKVVWVSRTEPAYEKQTKPYYLPTITSLVGLATAYVVFFPSRTITNASTRTFPQPTPLSPTGNVSNVVTTQMTTTNPAASSGSVSQVSNALVTGFLVTAPSATPVPTSAAPGLTWNAIDRLADKLIIATRCQRLRETNTKIDDDIARLTPGVDVSGPKLPIC